MKSLLTFFAVSAVFYSLNARPMPDADAVKYLKKLAQSSKNYQRRADKTYFFSRAQLKYGLERNDYLRRWCDRPLMQDSSYSRAGTLSAVTAAHTAVKVLSIRKHSLWKVRC